MNSRMFQQTLLYWGLYGITVIAGLLSGADLFLRPAEASVLRIEECVTGNENGRNSAKQIKLLIRNVSDHDFAISGVITEGMNVSLRESPMVIPQGKLAVVTLSVVGTTNSDSRDPTGFFWLVSTEGLANLEPFQLPCSSHRLQ